MQDKARRLPKAKPFLIFGCPMPAAGMPDHPLENIAHSVAWRLANPTNRAFLNREVKRAKGSNGRKSIIKNDGKLYGFAMRTLSATDLEEVRGCVSLVLAELGNPDKLDFAAWKRIFSEARSTLGMKRKVNRENLLDSLDTIDFHSELTLDKALIDSLAEEREQADSEQSAREESIAKAARHLLSLLFAARRSDTSRQKRANFETALRYLHTAMEAAIGNGHAHKLTRTAAYEQNRKFLSYVSQGEAQAAREAQAATLALEAEETARLMFAVCD